MKNIFKALIISLVAVDLFVSCNGSGITQDITPPAKVTDVNVQLQSNKIILTWKDSEDADLYGVKIYTGEVLENGINYFQNVIVLKGDQKFEASNLVDNKTYIFKLITIDTSLNQSEPVESEEIIFKEFGTFKYKCPTCNKEYNTSEEAANCCGAETKIIVVLPQGNYSIYHKLQKLDNLQEYELKETEENKSVAANSTIESIKHEFDGFSASSIVVNQKDVIVLYDRKNISYTFNVEAPVKFSNGATSITVSGLYESIINFPAKPVKDNYSLDKWVDGNGQSPEVIFGPEDKTFNAQWKVNGDFVYFSEQTVSTSIQVLGSSFYYASIVPVKVDDFYIAKNELTYSQWKEVYDWAVENGYTFANAGKRGYIAERLENTENEPVTNVSWRDALVWCNAASQKEGLEPVYYLEGTTDFTDESKVLKISEGRIQKNVAKDEYHEVMATADKAIVNTEANGYRLPTELEWEFAARGGDCFADAWTYSFAGSNDVYEVAWTIDDSGLRTHEVCSKKPNTAGLYDMSGNVWEWCWGTGLPESTYRYCRGGCWEDTYDYCYVAYPTSRSELFAWWYGNEAGFRLARSKMN